MLVPLRFYEPLQELKKEIQRKKREKKPIDDNHAFISWATFHILNVIRRVSEKENLSLDIELNTPVLVNKAIGHVRKIFQNEQTKRGKEYSHDKFFKEVQTNRIISEYIDSMY